MAGAGRGLVPRNAYITFHLFSCQRFLPRRAAPRRAEVANARHAQNGRGLSAARVHTFHRAVQLTERGSR